jgi:hypothetical protein
MATLDSLLVQIDASTELLRRELAKGGAAVDSFARNTERRAAGFADSFKKAGAQIRSVMGLFGVGFAVSGIKSFVTGAVQAADAIGETARAAGFGAERFQRLSFVFRQNGVSTQEFDAAMRTLNTRLGQFITTGAGPAEKAFTRLGISQRIASGEIRTAEQAYDAIAAAFGNIGNSAERAAIAAQLFGREAGSKLQDTLGRGAESINRAADAAQGILSDDTVRKADELADAWDRIASAAGNWAKSVTIAAAYEVSEVAGIVDPQDGADRRSANRRFIALGAGFGGPLGAVGAGAFRLSQARDMEAREYDRLINTPFIPASSRALGIFRPDGRPFESTEGLEDDIALPSWIKRGQMIGQPAGMRSMPDFASAVANTELKEISVALTKMPDDLRKLTPAFNEAVEANRRYIEGLTETAKRQDELWQTLGSGLQSALARSFRGISTNFSDLLKDMAAELAASAVVKGLTGFFSSLGSGKGFVGFFSGMFGGKRATGGPMQRGKGYLINEGKPELFWPGVSGSMVPVSKTAGGGTSGTNIYVDARWATDPAAVEAAAYRGGLAAYDASRQYTDEMFRAYGRPSIA